MNGNEPRFKVGDVVSIHYRENAHSYPPSIKEFFLQNNQRGGFSVCSVHPGNSFSQMYALKDKSGNLVKDRHGIIAFFEDELSLGKEETFNDDEWE